MMADLRCGEWRFTIIFLPIFVRFAGVRAQIGFINIM